MPGRARKLPFNEIVGQNVTRFRRAAGLSQAGLAEQLAERWGLIFQQQTILKIENGTRPLKLNEAMCLADVLAISIDDLTSAADEAVAARIEWNEAHVTLIQLKEQREQIGTRLCMIEEEIERAQVRAKHADELLEKLGIQVVTTSRSPSWVSNVPSGESVTFPSGVQQTFSSDGTASVTIQTASYEDTKGRRLDAPGEGNDDGQH